MIHIGYFDHEADSTPLPQYVEAKEAKAKAFRSFKRGMFLGAAAMAAGIFAADMAYSETIQIGRAYINGESFGSTTVTIAPSDVPGQLAVVTMQNAHVNQGSDDGDYSLTFDGVVFGVSFIWDQEPLLGSDRIVITPPAGITCLPIDCGVTVMEGADGSVILFEYIGF